MAEEILAKRVGFGPLTNAQAEAMVTTSSWEPRPENYAANHRKPTSGQLTTWRAGIANQGNPNIPQVNGQYTGTTNAITALKTLEHLGYSVIVGHTHRQSLVHKTTHDIDGKHKQILAAAETGCCCVVESDGLGFSPAPDWQQGCLTAVVWPDGRFKIDLATFVDGNLYWRDERY